jgi:hypothetical protein
MSMRWSQGQRQVMRLVLVLVTVLGVSMGGLQDAHAITITSVQPDISVTYDHSEPVDNGINSGVQYLFTVKNSGATTASTVNFGYIYTWIANGPQPVETQGKFSIGNLKAGATTHVSVFCGAGPAFCVWSYVAVLPGNYIVDSAHASASNF